jgi:MFS family permease
MTFSTSTPTPAQGDPQPQTRTPRGALAALALSMLLASLGTSLANVALPTLGEALGASFQSTQWVVLAYLLAITSLVVSAGRLGDVWGRRPVLLLGLGLFSLGAGLCAAAPSLAWLLAARALQGLGAAAMLALTLAFVADAVPKAQTGRAMGLLGAMSAIGTALGPALGGVVVAALGWRALFLLQVPLGLWALGLAARYLPKPPASTSAAGLDAPGTLLLAATLAAYALAMTWGHGHWSALNAVLLLAALLAGAALVWVEQRAAAPLLRLSLLREPVLRTGLAMNLLVATVMMSTLVVGPFYLSQALGLGAAQVGGVMALGPVVSALVGVPAGRVVDRWGSARITRWGLWSMALGSLTLGGLALASLPAAWGVLGYALPLVPLTAGYALFQAANQTAVMAGAPAAQRGLVSGWLNLARNLGLVSGASLMGAVFASAPQAAQGLARTFAVASACVALAMWLRRAA